MAACLPRRGEAWEFALPWVPEAITFTVRDVADVWILTDPSCIDFSVPHWYGCWQTGLLKMIRTNPVWNRFLVVDNVNKRTPMAQNLKIITFKDANDQWRWQMKKGGRIVADCGEGYQRRAACEKTLGSIINSIQQGAFTEAIKAEVEAET